MRKSIAYCLLLVVIAFVSCHTKKSVTSSQSVATVDSLVNIATLKTFSQFNNRNITIRIDSMDLQPLDIPCNAQERPKAQPRQPKAYGIHIDVQDTTATQASEQTTNDTHLQQHTARRDTTATQTASGTCATSFCDKICWWLVLVLIIAAASLLLHRQGWW